MPGLVSSEKFRASQSVGLVGLLPFFCLDLNDRPFETVLFTEDSYAVQTLLAVRGADRPTGLGFPHGREIMVTCPLTKFNFPPKSTWRTKRSLGFLDLGAFSFLG